MAAQTVTQAPLSDSTKRSIEQYKTKLLQSKNIIFHGAPGTGKTYLARQIATYIVSDGRTASYDELSPEEKEQIGFVQFHPSYDYTDFVEGLRPVLTDDGLGFELRDGIFKQFVDKARVNYVNSQKDRQQVTLEEGWKQAIAEFINNAIDSESKFKLKSGNNSFTIEAHDGLSIAIQSPKWSGNLYTEVLVTLLTAPERFRTPTEIEREIFPTKNKRAYYYWPLYEALINHRQNNLTNNDELEEKAKKIRQRKSYVFIIDEINRGEISKICGELFFAIDPGYRGPQGAVSTQYSNMKIDSNRLDESESLFYIPDNVYIIGTMNDIDRSVDIFDFAMRRRFRFINLKASDTQSMLDSLDNQKDDAIRRMNRLNDAIADVDGLGPNYQIGAAYFLKFKDMNAESLWSDYLEPLLQTYLQGLPNADTSMNKLESAFKRTTESTETDSTNASEVSGTVDNQLPVESS